MSVGLDWWSVVASTPVPQYSHHAVIIGSTVVLATITVIAAVTLLILWNRRGR